MSPYKREWLFVSALVLLAFLLAGVAVAEVAGKDALTGLFVGAFTVGALAVSAWVVYDDARS